MKNLHDYCKIHNKMACKECEDVANVVNKPKIGFNLCGETTLSLKQIDNLWPRVPPYSARCVAITDELGNRFTLEINQDTIEEIRSYFECCEDLMN